MATNLRAGIQCVLLALALLAQAALAAPCASFTDVDETSPFCANVAWLKNRSITLGCSSATLYCPTDPVGRLTMAAFLNRLGTALTPVQLWVDQAPGAIDLDDSPVLCQSEDFAADGFPRVAYATGNVGGSATGDVGLATDLVMSTNAGASWSALNLFSSRGLVRANQWGTLFDLGLAHMASEQTVRFGMRVSRTSGGADLVASRCALRVLVMGRDEREPALVKVAATLPNASEAGPMDGEFTVTRAGGDLGVPLVVSFTLGGTATNCSDYACIAAVVIPAQQAAVEVPVAVLPDGLAEGTETVVLNLIPGAGYLVATPSAVVTIANGTPPVNAPPTAEAGADQTITLPSGATLNGTATDDGNPNPPNALTLTWSKVSGPGSVTFNPASAAASAATFSQPGTYVLRLTANDGALTAFSEVTLTVNPAPSLPSTSIADFHSGVSFLYQGTTPLQTGVAPGTITPKRAAVIKGNVRDRSGTALAGARISILKRSEFGQTFSRADGNYDLVVNGGGKLIVRVEKAGYFEVQRDVIVPWQDFVYASDVVLTPPDSVASVLDLTLPTPQVARANAVTDNSGTRRATLIALPGTTAQFRMPNGSQQPAPSRLTVRQTEYTVGALGPASMPSELPPTSGYTYYLELTADEELAAGAIGVEFSQPVIFYLENFIGFAVGGNAPVGFYDRQNGVWKSEPDGRVLKVVAISGGLAELDTDGNGSADNGIGTGQSGSDLGISTAERQTLTGLYTAGQTLWRVATTHFSPGDINWPYGPPPDAVPPDGGDPDNEDRRKSPCDCPPCQGAGSIIECGNQTLGESIPIVGTGMSLNYRSDRVPGRLAANRLGIPITGATVPGSLEAATLEVTVAGQRHTQRLGTATAQSTSFAWDGKDTYGRTVQGQQKARVRVGFEYEAVFQATPQDYYRSWALANGNPTGIAARNRAVLYRDFDVTVGAWDARGQALGGWSLSEHHVYDHLTRQLYLGNGERRRDVDGLAPVVSTIAGNGTAGAPVEGGQATASPMVVRGSIAVEPDGAVLFRTVNTGTRLLRLKTDGTLERIAGSLAVPAPPIFGVTALNGTLAFSEQFARGPDGSIYVTHPSRGIITRIRPDDQFVEVFAGTFDQPGFSGDGGPATSATLNQPRDIAVGSDGSVFVHDAANRRIRRIGPDGFIATVAGNGDTCGGLLPDPQCDEGPALGQKIGSATTNNHLAVAPDGALWAIRPAGTFGALTELYRIGTDGVLRVIAGKREIAPQSVDEGTPARSANILNLRGLAFDRDGLVYFGLPYGIGSNRTEIRFIDRTGHVRVLAGSTTGFGGDGGPARSARFNGLLSLAFNPGGELVFLDSANNRIRRLQSRFPGFTGTADILLPASDGRVVYRFDPNGRHLQTLHGLTGSALLNFGYDRAGRLTTVTDGNTNVTTIQRNGAGAPTAIVAPFGEVTQLATDANGWLTQVTNPANETVGLAHQANGLLTGMTTPKGQSYAFAYEAATGYLLNDADPAGGSQALARTDLPPDATRLFGYDVAKTTALGRTTGYRTERLRKGDRIETATQTDGTMTVITQQSSGGWMLVDPTGSATSGLRGADSRFGMLAPVAASDSTRTPGGKTLTMTETVSASLSDPANIFSLSSLGTTASLNGRNFTTAYSGATREVARTSAAGRVATGTIDALGRPTALQFGGLAASVLTYDPRGRLTSTTTGNGAESRLTTFAYDGQGRLQSMTDAIGRVTSFTYDAAGRQLTQAFPDGRLITFAYDGNGNPTSVLPPSRPAHTYAYTGVDLESRYDPPDMPGVEPDAVDLIFNADRQPTSLSRPDGRGIVPSYDAAGRLSAMTFSRGSVSLSYHASTGQMSAVTAPEGIHHTLGYDGPLLLSHAITGPVSGVVAWTYDNDFRVASQSVNGDNTVNLTYDADSLLTQVGTLSLARNPQHGLVIGTTLGTIVDTWAYNSHAEVIDYQASASSLPLYRAQFTRDSLGRITQKVETTDGVVDTHVYTYDLAGRLVGVLRNGVLTSYAYDGNSNRLGVSGPLGMVTGALYDAQDRLVQYGSVSYAYNNSGELTAKTQSGVTTQYNYDEFGNLTRVVLPGGTQIDYVIDAMNRRIGKKVNGSFVKRWLYDGKLRVVAELDGGGAVVSRFVYGERVNVPEYVVQGGVTYRLIADYLGSPRLLVNAASGTIAGVMDHDEYGRVTRDSLSSLIPFGYAGGMYEPSTGLVRFMARDYDAETGRWTTRDPKDFGGGSPNLWAYVDAEPVNRQDPRGLEGPPGPGAGIFTGFYSIGSGSKNIASGVSNVQGGRTGEGATDLTVGATQIGVGGASIYVASQTATQAAATGFGASTITAGGATVTVGLGASVGIGVVSGASVAFAQDQIKRSFRGDHYAFDVFVAYDFWRSVLQPRRDPCPPFPRQALENYPSYSPNPRRNMY